MRHEIISLLESKLGLSSQRRRDAKSDNLAFKCANPSCSSHYKSKKKLEVDLISKMWHCWVCHIKGSDLDSLLRELDATHDTRSRMSILLDGEFDHNRFNSLVNPSKKIKLQLPEKAFPLLSKKTKQTISACNFLINRGLRKIDIQRYNIHFCEDGSYGGRVIIPNYGATGILTNYTCRTIYADTLPKYLGPDVDRGDVIGFDSFINWNLPIILVEGSFDAMSIRYNAIPLDGTFMSRSLKSKIIIHRPTVYVCLDEMAHKNAISICSILYNLGLSVYYTQLPKDSDPNDLGFNETWNSINNNSQRVDLRFLVENKL